MNRRLSVTIGVGVCAIIGALAVVKVVKAERSVPIAPEFPLKELMALVPEELRFEPLRVSDESNAWIGLAEVTRKSPKVTFQNDVEQTARSQKYREESRKLIAKFEQTLTDMQAALARPSIAISSLEGDQNPVPIMVKLRSFVTLFGIRSILKLDDGDENGAVADLEAAVRIPMRVNEAGPPLDYAVIGSSLLSRALRDVRTAARHPKMSDAGVLSLMKTLPRPEDIEAGFNLAVRSDLYWFIREQVTRLKGPGLSAAAIKPVAGGDKDELTGWGEADRVAADLLDGHPKPFDRKATVQSAVAVYREVIANSKKDWDGQTSTGRLVYNLVSEWPRYRLAGYTGETEFEKAEMEKAKPLLLASQNPYGRFALWFFLSLSDQSDLVPFRNRADVEATRMYLALRVFEMRNKRAPISLDELVQAGLISEVPADPFNGKELRYDAQQRKYWSVGPDKVDNGGNGLSLSHGSEDFVWRF